ncbi:MAG: adaptor protein MecA [Peptococcaceae bacterium]|nr:adaptor protein MecA [Peptococcaceae bacterium]
MRILKVNDNTVRIFISFAELADRDISLQDFFHKTARTEQFLWELIYKARGEVDFSLDQPFWMQVTVISDEEFAITIVKQEDYGDKEMNNVLHALEVEEKRSRSRSSQQGQGDSKFPPNQEWVYAFEDLEDVFNATKALPDLATSSMLYELEGEYYLVVGPMKGLRKKKLAEAILDEYGEAILTSVAFLREHAACVIPKEALEKLAFAK